MTTSEKARGVCVADAGSLRIRLKTVEDLRDDYRWRTDPENARFDGQPPVSLTLDEYLERASAEVLYPGPTRRSFSLDDSDGHHIGNLMFYNVSYDRESAEVGIAIGEETLRGHGLGSLAMVTFLRYLWDNYPFRRLYLHTLEWNERARAAFRRAGFDEVARLNRGGQWFVRMEVRREWWLMWDAEGRFASIDAPAPQPGLEAGYQGDGDADASPM